MRATVLAVHNQARASFGVAPLIWNEALAAEAMRHAMSMAASGIYAHDRTPGRRKSQGENMWRGPRGLYGYDAMIGLLVEERRQFRPGVYPDVSRTGDWRAVAHYTQIVWPTTTDVGCALASSASTDYFVCRYAPPGNKDGNVLGGPAL